MANSIVCSIEGCGKKVKAKGLCNGHYKRNYRYGNPLSSAPLINNGKCSLDGCEKPSKARGYCSAHHARLMRHGDPHFVTPKNRPRTDWIQEKKGYTGDDCIKWPFSKDLNGRGRVRLGGLDVSAPRAMCIAAHGKPPTPKHEAAHSCGNGHLGCMNPNHLRWATRAENVKDMVAHDRSGKGEKNVANKLSEKDVIFIKSQRGLQSCIALAKIFGVDPSTISSIHTGKNWGWLSCEDSGNA